LNTNLYTGEISKMPHHTNILPCKTVVEEMNDNGIRAFEVMPDISSAQGQLLQANNPAVKTR
jgi:hypothetical protein